MTDKNERDNCQVCRGARGGVKGNENRLDGIVVCDYCHSTIMTFRELTARPVEVCRHCDGTGDVHRVDGEWLGSCDCGAVPS